MWGDRLEDYRIRVLRWCSMMKLTKSLSTGIAILASATMLSVFVPAATAVGQGNGAVASARSFRVQAPRKNLLQESVSTTVDGATPWALTSFKTDVPKTQSPAEKAADEAARAAAQRQAEQAAAAAQQAAAASRSEARQPLSTASRSTGNSAALPAPSGNVSGVLNLALAIAANDEYGYGGCTPPTSMDCSCFVQYVFGLNGVSLPRTSGAQASAGVGVPDISQALPGDIIANGGHVAIYLGNGQIVDAENRSSGIRTNQLVYLFPGGPGSYAIRRLM